MNSCSFKIDKINLECYLFQATAVGQKNNENVSFSNYELEFLSWHVGRILFSDIIYKWLDEVVWEITLLAKRHERKKNRRSRKHFPAQKFSQVFHYNYFLLLPSCLWISESSVILKEQVEVFIPSCSTNLFNFRLLFFHHPHSSISSPHLFSKEQSETKLLTFFSFTSCESLITFTKSSLRVRRGEKDVIW